MGHSTVSFTRKGKLSFSEIIKEFKNTQENDRQEYGYSESPDSFYRASSPSQRYLGKIYSPIKANEIIEKVGNYDCFALYTVSNKLFTEIYKKQFDKINKIKEKIKSLNAELIKQSDLAKESLKNSKKTVFLLLPCCKSKINITALHKEIYQSKKRCSVCDAENIGDISFENWWREKNLGKSYAKFKLKTEEKIKKLQLEIDEIEKSIPEEINEGKLTKSQKEEIKTVVFADVHH